MKLNEVYPKIVPPKGVEMFVYSINSSLKRLKIDAEAIMGGSYAKNDYLNNPDIDIFVVFSQEYKGKDISALLNKALSKFKPIRVHGSRDYFHIKNFEVVPVLKVDSAAEAENITDMSPLHVHWVSKHIKGLNDDVRLAKLFCDSAGIYGAESHIMGFSGYILELLVINYGGFDNMIKAVAKWRPKVFIDIEQYYDDFKDVMNTLNEAKSQSPLIVIDPVQPDRNASASVSMDTFSKFILAANQYLMKPDKKFFRHHQISIKDISKISKARKTKLFIVAVKPLDGKDDVVGSKLMKAYNYIRKQLELSDFLVFNSGWNFDFFYFELYDDKLPKMRKHYGPLVWVQGENMKKFLSKYDDVYVDNNRLLVYVPRKFSNAKDFFADLVKHKEVKMRLKGAKCLRK